MDGLAALLAEARTAGLTICRDGDRLVVRGPRSATALATRLLAHKADVLAALAADEAAIAERMRALRPLVPLAGPIPFLVVRPERAVRPGWCLSCGEPLGPAERFRCRLCVAAIRRVIAEVESGRRRSRDAP